jgi:hypothetical protein
MKKQLFLYLFILTALFTVFTYMYFSKALKAEEKRYETTKKILRDSIQIAKQEAFDANYFSLETNDNAQNYLEKYDVTKLIPKIREDLLAYNDSNEGNKYTGQEKMGDQKFIINKIKILNHRWIIADYSNGQLWGEVYIKYFINADDSISFQVEDTFLYQKQQY